MSETNIHRTITKQLRNKANDFLNSRKNANNLVELISFFEENLEKNENISPFILTLEVVFAELLKRREFYIEIKPLKPKDTSPEAKYKEWLFERYTDFCRLLLQAFYIDKPSDASQALATSMKLLSLEAKFPIENTSDTYYFPTNRLRSILSQLLSSEHSTLNLISRFKEFSEYLDVVFHAWKLIQSLTPKGQTPNEIFVRNYFALINALQVTKELQQTFKIFGSMMEVKNYTFDYSITRKCINKSWQCVMQWNFTEGTHQQVLVVLLERILPHLDKPVLLTDFLMDSLDMGGVVSLLALQGIFTLIQKYNITYPNIYEKLYSMFEPEIFYTKYKARLFYLADIFLSSTHLPENLVAAFVKRLARLSLLAGPSDILIIIYFIGNLLMRHAGLKRLICDPNGPVSPDPYIMEERNPVKSNALESTLWEIVALQSHVIPTVAQKANLIKKQLPDFEFDLAEVLNMTDEDMFYREISKKCKDELQIGTVRDDFFGDNFTKYWNIS